MDGGRSLSLLKEKMADDTVSEMAGKGIWGSADPSSQDRSISFSVALWSLFGLGFWEYVHLGSGRVSARNNL